MSKCDAIKSSAHDVQVAGWRAFLLWPSDGSPAMSRYVKSSLAQHVCAVMSLRHVHALDLAGRPRPTAGSRVRFICVRGPHDADEYADFLVDFAQMAGQPPRATQIVAIGDWNADIAQALPRPTFGRQPAHGSSPA